jgi:type 1 fimbriae regulatory protein FimB
MSERTGLTQQETTKLLAAVEGDRNKAILVLGFGHGFRSSEIADLQLSDVDLDNGLLTVRRGKGSETNIHSLLPGEAALLAAVINSRERVASPYVFVSQKGGKLDRSQIFRIFQQAAEKAGLPAHKRHYHCAKHTVAHTMLANGATLPEVQKYLGWKSLATAGRYLAVSDETACKAAQRALGQVAA